jgi:hypothetical protein
MSIRSIRAFVLVGAVTALTASLVAAPTIASASASGQPTAASLQRLIHRLADRAAREQPDLRAQAAILRQAAQAAQACVSDPVTVACINGVRQVCRQVLPKLPALIPGDGAGPRQLQRWITDANNRFAASKERGSKLLRLFRMLPPPVIGCVLGMLEKLGYVHKIDGPLDLVQLLLGCIQGAVDPNKRLGRYRALDRNAAEPTGPTSVTAIQRR